MVVLEEEYGNPSPNDGKVCGHGNAGAKANTGQIQAIVDEDGSAGLSKSESVKHIRKFLDHEVLKLQNNIYKLYTTVKIIENREEFSMRDLKMLANFAHRYIFDHDNPYDDEDFTRICNIEALWSDGDNDMYLGSLPRKQSKIERKKIHEEEKEELLELLKNISEKYFRLEFLVRLGIEGMVMYGKYLGQRILITKDEHCDTLYSVKIWYDDNDSEYGEKFIGVDKELMNFLKNHEIVVKWAE
jgi:hypothetical protein